jgi:hypothetical protein
LAHRARGDATRRTGSGQLELGAAEIVRTPGLASTLQATPETLNSAIRLLTADPVLARSMGEAGRWHAEAHFSWDALPRWKICTKASVVNSPQFLPSCLAFASCGLRRRLAMARQT